MEKYEAKAEGFDNALLATTDLRFEGGERV